MAFQFGNYGNWSVSQGSKRRMRDDEEEKEEYHGEGLKRFNDERTHQQWKAAATKPITPPVLPSITYASPDYRPPPRQDALWLQPPPQPSMTMDEDLTDEESLPTPSSSLQHHHQVKCFSSPHTTGSATFNHVPMFHQH